MKLFGRRKSADTDMPSERVWSDVLSTRSIFAGLAQEDAQHLRALAGDFLRNKQLYPVEGVEVDERLAATVAAMACLPVLRLGIEWYREFATIVLTHDEFYADSSDIDSAGVVHEVVGPASGQVLELWSMVLSIADIEASGRGSGYNVVIHEMAHALDRLDGSFDGIPPVPAVARKRWHDCTVRAFDDFQRRATHNGPRRDYDTSRRMSRAGRSEHRERKDRRNLYSRRVRNLFRSGIDPYGAESREEFFAVCSEVFFERPWVLEREYPEVYELYSTFYRQDPRSRMPYSPASRIRGRRSE